MHYLTRRIARNIHIAAALYNVAYIYTPIHAWSYGLAVLQYISFPLLIVTGLYFMSAKRLAKKLATKTA
ncbi:MAG: hypothetical protein GC131_02080 [Alphaproteobacteria bacterium]|nr:hypothetical protein [Alphaproteobacteria bacterium]